MDTRLTERNKTMDIQTEKLIFLGTGHAMTLDCYNTCFLLQDASGENILVDTGGGQQILRQLRDADIDFCKIHHIILSHRHSDHILGLIWIVRKFYQYAASGEYEGNLHLYLHKELEKVVRTMFHAILAEKFVRLMDGRILFHVVEDQDVKQILDYSVKFLDIHSEKDRQFGFRTILQNGKTLVFLGDETCKEALYDEVRGCDWLLHEAFCPAADAELLKPYEKKHSTVKDAAQIARKLDVGSLILYHGNDKDLPHRKQNYETEARQYFHGDVYAPDDLDVIIL